jgi:hypothetical protein
MTGKHAGGSSLRGRVRTASRRRVQVEEHADFFAMRSFACFAKRLHRVLGRDDLNPIAPRRTRIQPPDQPLPWEAAADRVVACLRLAADRPGAPVQRAVEAGPVQIQTRQGEAPARAEAPALHLFPRGQVQLDLLNLLAQPLDVIDDRLSERRNQWIPIAEHDAIDQVEMQKLEHNARSTRIQLDEQARQQPVLRQRSRDIRSQPTLAPQVTQRAEHRTPTDEQIEDLLAGERHKRNLLIPSAIFQPSL